MNAKKAVVFTRWCWIPDPQKNPGRLAKLYETFIKKKIKSLHITERLTKSHQIPTNLSHFSSLVEGLKDILCKSSQSQRV